MALASVLRRVYVKDELTMPQSVGPVRAARRSRARAHSRAERARLHGRDSARSSDAAQPRCPTEGRGCPGSSTQDCDRSGAAKDVTALVRVRIAHEGEYVRGCVINSRAVRRRTAQVTSLEALRNEFRGERGRGAFGRLDGVPDIAATDRFGEALRLAADGVALMRQNLRRRHVDESDEQIEERLEAWLRGRPMDAPGQVVEGALP
jgi:hypothetical protein